MSRFIDGETRSQSTLFPERVDDHVGEDSAVRRYASPQTAFSQRFSSVGYMV